MKIEASRDCHLSPGTFGSPPHPQLTKKSASFRVKRALKFSNYSQCWSSNHNLGNISGLVQYCVVCVHQVGWVSRLLSFRCVLHLQLHLQASLGPSRFWWETLSLGRGWCESFPRNEVVVFRLYLYQMDPMLIRQSRPLDDAWFGDLRDCLGNCRNLLVRILRDRRHRRSLYLGVENSHSRLLVIRYIRNAVVDHCPHIPSFVPRLSGPRCYHCRLLGLAVVVFYWLH